MTLPSYTTGEKTSHTRKKTLFTTKEVETNEEVLKKERDKIYAKSDGLGPGSYPIHKHASGPIFSFGSRFNSSVRNKDHLRTRKVDGPGPGAYKLPGSV